MQARIEAGADRRHGRGLGEDLGIRADADLEILAPGSLRDQHVLEMHRLGRAGLELRQVVADELADLLADRRRGGRVAARLLLDDALQHGDGEGHAGGLHRLEVERREQPGPGAIASIDRRVGEDGGQRADDLPLRLAQRPRRIRLLAEVAAGGEGGGDVDEVLAAQGDDGRPAPVRPPDAPEQDGRGMVRGQGGMRGKRQSGHRQRPEKRSIEPRIRREHPFPGDCASPFQTVDGLRQSSSICH